MAGVASPTRLAMIIGSITDGPFGRGTTQLGNRLIPNKVPGFDALLQAYVRSWIRDERLVSGARLNGIKLPDDFQRAGVDFTLRQGRLVATEPGWFGTDDTWMAALWAAWERFDLHTLQVLLNRGVVNERDAHQILMTDGWESAAERQILLNLRKIIPPPGQILDMELRGALDPMLLGQNALGAEFTERFATWCRANGLTVASIPSPVDGEPPIELDFAKALWALHWQLPTVPDYLEMRRRLRPSLANPAVSSDPSGIILSPDIATSIWQQNSIHPDWREPLRAISYRPVSFRHIDIMYEFQEIDERGVAEILLDTGYAPAYALKVARARVKNIRRRRNKAVYSEGKIQVEAAWELGSIGDAEYLAHLQALDFTPDEAQQSLALAGVEHTRKRLDRQVKAVKQQVLTGQMSMDQSEGLLLSIGLNSDRIAEYRSDWGLQLSGRRRLLSARENLKAAEEGLLSLADLVDRLRNLRYADSDINIFLGELQLALAARLAKAASAAAAAHEKSRREAERAARQIKEALLESRRALASHGSPSKLKTWYCDDLISEQEVYDRLRFLGWPDPDIARLLDECALKKHPKPKVPVPPGG